jgi:hypothetical protein
MIPDQDRFFFIDATLTKPFGFSPFLAGEEQSVGRNTDLALARAKVTENNVVRLVSLTSVGFSQESEWNRQLSDYRRVSDFLTLILARVGC